MRGHTHQVIGAAAGGLTAAPLLHRIGLGYALLLVVVSAVAALLPDIDHPLSLAGRCIPRLLWPWVVDGQVYWLSKPHWSSHFRRWGRWRPGGVIWHRGELHSLGAALLVTVGAGTLVVLAVQPVGVAPKPVLTLTVLLGSLVGYLSHLLADLANPSPMMLLWPLSRRHYRPRWLPAVRESSWQGRLLEWGCYPPALALLAVTLARASS